jgi:hypothetical protein
MAKPGVHPLSARVVSVGSIKTSSGMTPAFRSAAQAAGTGRIVSSKRGGGDKGPASGPKGK